MSIQLNSTEANQSKFNSIKFNQIQTKCKTCMLLTQFADNNHNWKIDVASSFFLPHGTTESLNGTETTSFFIALFA